MNEYVTKQLLYLKPPLYNDIIVENNIPEYDFFNNPLNEKIRELHEFYNKTKVDVQIQCDLIDDFISEKM